MVSGWLGRKEKGGQLGNNSEQITATCFLCSALQRRKKREVGDLFSSELDEATDENRS